MAKFVFIIIMLSIIGCTIKPQKSVPEEYVAGQKYFHQVCANCHGMDAAGGNKAPTFLQEKFHLDAIYWPKAYYRQSI